MASFAWQKDCLGLEDGLKEAATEPGTAFMEIPSWSTETRAGENLEDAKAQTDKGCSGDRVGRDWQLWEVGETKEEAWMTQVLDLVESEYITGHVQFWTR